MDHFQNKTQLTILKFWMFRLFIVVECGEGLWRLNGEWELLYIELNLYTELNILKDWPWQSKLRYWCSLSSIPITVHWPLESLSCSSLCVPHIRVQGDAVPCQLDQPTPSEAGTVHHQPPASTTAEAGARGRLWLVPGPRPRPPIGWRGPAASPSAASVTPCDWQRPECYRVPPPTTTTTTHHHTPPYYTPDTTLYSLGLEY